ncbi:MAG: hypothetical protein K1W19_03230 [Lachnospiraceae bacterium]
MELIETFDKLKIYCGGDYYINEHISIRQPTLSEICRYGEKDYFNMVYTLCSVGADLKWQLADMNIDYTEISDFQLFYSILARRFTKEETGILFGDVLDFSKMILMFDEELQDTVFLQLLDNGECLRIDRSVYSNIVSILRKMHRIKRNNEIPGNEATKKILIEDAKEEYEENKNKPYKSFLLPLISSMVNSEGFKHNEETVFNMKIYSFMDSVQRIGKIKNADLLTQSGYSGFGVDLKKIDKETLNWMGELD